MIFWGQFQHELWFIFSGDDNTLSTTVLPYLVELHMPPDETEELMDQPYITEHELRKQEKRLQDEAAAIISSSNPTTSNSLSRKNSKTTKCIKVKKLTGCSVSWCWTDVWKNENIREIRRRQKKYIHSCEPYRCIHTYVEDWKNVVLMTAELTLYW